MPLGETGLLDSHHNILPSRVWATPEENIRTMKEKKTSGWTWSLTEGIAAACGGDGGIEKAIYRPGRDPKKYAKQVLLRAYFKSPRVAPDTR